MTINNPLQEIVAMVFVAEPMALVRRLLNRRFMR